MPSYNHTLRRIYCKSCNDFKLHNNVKEDIFYNRHLKDPVYCQIAVDLIESVDKDETIYTCCECNTKYEPVSFSTIDPEKILAQQARYKAYRKQQLDDMMGIYTNMIDTIISDFYKVGFDVIESDAGLENIEKAEQQLKNQKAYDLQTYINKFDKTERNDKCPCGSDVKFKKCCLPKVREANDELKYLTNIYYRIAKDSINT